MEHYKEGQYDDDLTVGIDEYDEDFDTGSIDLFDYVGDDDSPLSRLKSIILSIDWEITDDILRQFNEELLNLKDTWHDNKVNLIYVQALEKISRYIYKEKASAHPNAIKLLLTFYTNLEKIVSDDLMSDQDKKSILLEDIERFERLKKQIAPSSAPKPEKPVAEAPRKTEEPVVKEAVSDAIRMPVESDQVNEMKVGEAGTADPLLNLKAIVYGIDWEITERDLLNLGREVKLLEEEFKTSKAKQIFLQGIGSLGSYINLKRSDSHADAFKLLHSFFTGLETVVRRNLTGQAEKDILLPEVEKFNSFKAAVANTLASDSLTKSSIDQTQEEEFPDSEIQPAFSDVPDDVHGFKEEDEIAALEKKKEIEEDPVDVYFDDDEELHDVDEDILAEEMESRLSGMFEEPEKTITQNLNAEVALQGVDVETDADDESEEEPLPEEDGELSPALAAEDPPFDAEGSPAKLAEKVDEFFGGTEEADELETIEESLPGVDVEHEADDDSDEEPLPFEAGEFAPALSADETIEEEDIVAESDETSLDSDIEGNLDNFFGEDDEQVDIHSEESAEDIGSFETNVASESDVEDKFTDFFGEETEEAVTGDSETALKGIEVEHEADDDSDEAPLLYEDGELAPALSADGDDEEVGEVTVEAKEEEFESAVEDGFDDLFSDDELLKEEDSLAPEETESDESFDFTADPEDTLLGEEDEDVDALDAVDALGSNEVVDELDLSEDEEEIAAADTVVGVDVETEDDDDSAEEPLPFEDGELAPALAADEDSGLDFDDEGGDSEEAEVADRFDTLFAEEAEDEALFEESSESDETALSDADQADDVETFFDKVEEDQTEDLLETDDEVESFFSEDQETAFSQAGFEEIADEDIDEISDEVIAGFSEEDDSELGLLTEPDDTIEVEEDELPGDDDELMALLGEDADPAPAFTDYEQESVTEDELIPEISSDELENILLEGEGVTAAGEIPSGYPSADELLSEFGDIAGESDDEVFHPEGNEDFIIGVIEEEIAETDEEVVFEAVEDEEPFVGDAGLADDDISDFSVDLDEKETFGTTLLSEEVRPEGAHGRDELSETEIDLTSDLDSDLLGEPQTADGSAYIIPQTVDPADGSLNGLRNCIVSLGLEIDDTIINSLNEEINQLRHNWLDRPAEKTFVQLLSTIADHIDTYRYEADPQSNTLLLSVFDKLELCALGQIEPSQIQESLLTETSKVLQWQQSLINRTQRDDTSSASLQVEDKSSDTDLLGEAGETKDLNIALDDMSKQVDAIGNDLLMERVSSIMKSELEQLKSAFQAELKDLKNEIMRGKQ